MNQHSSLETVTKVSHGIREEVDLGRGFSEKNGVLTFDEVAIKKIEARVEAIFEKLSQLQETHTDSQIEIAVVRNVEVIMTSPKIKGIAKIRERLNGMKKGKEEKRKEDSPVPIVTESSDLFGEIYIVYTDEEGREKTFPIPLTIRLSYKGLDWNTHWTSLFHVLKSKVPFARIFNKI